MLLYRWEKDNKYKHGKHCQNKHKHFSPFILSSDRMIRRESQFVLANLSRLMAEKMEEAISHVSGWVNGRITIMIMKLYYHTIHEDNLPNPFWYREPDWESGLGLVLVQ